MANGQNGSMKDQSTDATFFDRFRKVPGDVKLLVEKRMELWGLRIGEVMTGLFTESMYRLTGVVLMAVSGLLLLIALATFVGELVGDESLGYLIVAAPFLLLGLLFINKRPKFLIRRTQNQMMEQFYQSLQDKKKDIDQDDSAAASTSDDSTTEKSNKKTD